MARTCASCTRAQTLTRLASGRRPPATATTAAIAVASAKGQKVSTNGDAAAAADKDAAATAATADRANRRRCAPTRRPAGCWPRRFAMARSASVQGKSRKRHPLALAQPSGSGRCGCCAPAAAVADVTQTRSRFSAASNSLASYSYGLLLPFVASRQPRCCSPRLVSFGRQGASGSRDAPEERRRRPAAIPATGSPTYTYLPTPIFTLGPAFARAPELTSCSRRRRCYDSLNQERERESARDGRRAEAEEGEGEEEKEAVALN